MEGIKEFINRRFKGQEPWQIALKTACATTALFGAGRVACDINEMGFGEYALSIAKQTPFLKDIIENEMAKEGKKVGMSITSKEVLEWPVNAQLPSKGVSREDLMKDLAKWAEIERTKYGKGQVSGTVYHGEKDLYDFIAQIYSLFCLSNPLHPSTFPFVQKMESEVVSMTLNIFQAPTADYCGVTTSGGTESICMAMKAYRDQGYARGIRRPEIIACVTAHAAFDKAANYFGMKLVHIPSDSKHRIDLAKAKKAISRNTVVIVCSAPSYAQGTIDPVEEMADIVSKAESQWGYKIGLHVDCCLGGFLAPFVRLMPEYKLPKFDFSVPQVTSISADTHKYGYSPKGTSVLMFSSNELRRQMYFTAPKWTGGIYATPSMSGSRPGGLIAATWGTMMHMGMEGYMNASRAIMETATIIKEGVSKIPGLEVMGGPELSVVGIRSTNPELNIYAVGAAMGHDGGHEWELNMLQNPACIHICCTYIHKGLGPKFVKEIQESVEHVLANKEKYAKNSTVAIYGTTKVVPPSMVGELSKSFIDALFKLPEPQQADEEAKDGK
eukprot:jgi/Bigna1/77133/fgenesh1_pg.46_\